MSSLFGSAASTVTLLTQGFEDANSKLKTMATPTLSRSQPNVSSSIYSSSNSISKTGQINSNNLRKQSGPFMTSNGNIPYQSEFCTTIAPKPQALQPTTSLPQNIQPAIPHIEVPEVPDLSQLSEEERKIIEAVMQKQKNEEDEEKDVIE